jgi:hypothetical protein
MSHRCCSRLVSGNRARRGYLLLEKATQDRDAATLISFVASRLIPTHRRDEMVLSILKKVARAKATRIKQTLKEARINEERCKYS